MSLSLMEEVVDNDSKKEGVMAPMEARYDWDMVDWKQQDIVIARALGCSREAVRQQRAVRGHKKSPFHRLHRNRCKPIILAMDTARMTVEEVAEKALCGRQYAYMVLHQFKKPYLRTKYRQTKYDWAKADWTKTDAENAKALGIANPAVVTQRRIRYDIRRGDKYNWYGVDWRQSDKEIARSMGIKCVALVKANRAKFTTMGSKSMQRTPKEMEVISHYKKVVNHMIADRSDRMQSSVEQDV